MITSSIDALEGCEVEGVDIPGTYLSANTDDEVYIRFQDTLTELMVTEELSLYMPFLSYKDSKVKVYV